MKTQFKELRFKTEAEFNEWLLKETHIILDFEGDRDLQRVHLHKSGEILHCNLQGGIWNGRFISIKGLKKGRNIMMSNHYNGGQFTEMSFIVRKITNS